MGSLPLVSSPAEPSGFAPADGGEVVEFRGGIELVGAGGARVQLVAGPALPPGRQVIVFDGGLLTVSPIVIPDVRVAPKSPSLVQVPAPAAPTVIEAVYLRCTEASGSGGANFLAIIAGRAYSLGPVDATVGAVSGGRPLDGLWARFLRWLTGSPDPSISWTGGLSLTSVSGGSTLSGVITIVTRRVG